MPPSSRDEVSSDRQRPRGTSQVLIGRRPAHISNWTDTLIVAYVPEETPLGTTRVRVVTDGGESNGKGLEVIARSGEGRVLWRFPANAPLHPGQARRRT